MTVLETERTAPPTGATAAIRPAVPGPAPESAQTKSGNRRQYVLFALFAFPNLLLIGVFAYWPILGNLALSLTDWDMISPMPNFIGLDNYTALFSDPGFIDVMRRTLIWVVAVVGSSLIFGLGMALLFNGGARGGKAVSTLAFTPHVISGAAVAAVWLFIFDPNYGLSRLLFNSIGMDSPHWTTDPDKALGALIIVAVWKGAGFVAIVYLAALQSIPRDVIEAAQLDGAGRWKTFTKIVWPLLTPTTFFLCVTQIIGAFQAFDLIAMMTSGGPAGSTTTLSWYIYEQGFQEFNIGSAAASSVFMFVILLLVTAVQMRFAERKVHYS